MRGGPPAREREQALRAARDDGAIVDWHCCLCVFVCVCVCGTSGGGGRLRASRARPPRGAIYTALLSTRTLCRQRIRIVTQLYLLYRTASFCQARSERDHQQNLRFCGNITPHRLSHGIKDIVCKFLVVVDWLKANF
jgi:hypothetical protein